MSFLLAADVLTMPAAYFKSDRPKHIQTLKGLRAPEQLFGDEASDTLDIWAFGVLVFEFIIGMKLFELDYEDPEDDKDQHLLELSGVIGPLPEYLYNRWTRSSEYYTSGRVLYNTIVSRSGRRGGYDPLMCKFELLEVYFDRHKLPSISNEEATAMKALIRRTLQYDPAKRPTPTELLQDRWFTTEFEHVWSLKRYLAL
jgi:serine/threonine protein kinase